MALSEHIKQILLFQREFLCRRKLLKHSIFFRLLQSLFEFTIAQSLIAVSHISVKKLSHFQLLEIKIVNNASEKHFMVTFTSGKCPIQILRNFVYFGYFLKNNDLQLWGRASVKTFVEQSLFISVCIIAQNANSLLTSDFKLVSIFVAYSFAARKNHSTIKNQCFKLIIHNFGRKNN